MSGRKLPPVGCCGTPPPAARLSCTVAPVARLRTNTFCWVALALGLPGCRSAMLPNTTHFPSREIRGAKPPPGVCDADVLEARSVVPGEDGVGPERASDCWDGPATGGTITMPLAWAAPSTTEPAARTATNPRRPPTTRIYSPGSQSNAAQSRGHAKYR